VSHLSRPRHDDSTPLHVTWRVSDDLPNLRRPSILRGIERAFVKGCARFGFRLVHYSVQRNHIHMICEARDKRAVSRGLQGLAIRVARGLNRRLGRKGKVFADRYHARALRSPKEVRHALRYVLLNARRHGTERDEHWIDPCTSGGFFDGFRGFSAAAVRRAWKERPRVPVAPARTWLLRTGWRRHGLLQTGDTPGPQQGPASGRHG
jgi:REP element-mobilizing transposase RayT